jgi:hypothetical protein
MLSAESSGAWTMTCSYEQKGSVDTVSYAQLRLKVFQSTWIALTTRRTLAAALRLPIVLCDGLDQVSWLEGQTYITVK